MNDNLNPQSNMNDEIDLETLQKLQRLKPDVKPDAKFASMLRQEIGELAQSKSVSLDKSSKQSLTFFSFMNKLIIPLVAVAVVAAGTGYWYANYNGNPLAGIEGNQLLSDKYAVVELNENSFGNLSEVKIVASNQSGQGGDSAASAESDKMMAPGSGGGNASDISILPYPAPDQGMVTYEYGGEEITNLPEEQGVLKRTKPEQNEGIVSRIIRIFSFGLIDLTKFQNTKIQNVSFIEDREYGLSANIDLTYGNISMYQNWEKWPQPRYECVGYYCGPQPPIKPEDVPSDEDAIRIAEEFLKTYSISLEGYDRGEVYDYSNWRILYEQAEDKSQFYIPEQVNVLFPLNLNGQKVYDESGNPAGMSVMIDVRTKRVASMYGLETKQFEKSGYIGETDVKRIMEIALRGGYRNYPWYSEQPMTLKLATPKVELVKMYYTSDINKPGEELYVPSLVFPITNVPEENYWKRNVVVPLVKDILDNENIYGNPYPMPMPIDEPPATEEPVEDPMPVEPDGGIGDTPVSIEPAVLRQESIN